MVTLHSNILRAKEKGAKPEGEPILLNLLILLIFIFCEGFRGLEWFHDVPDPPGIISGPGITSNRGMASISDQFLSFSDHFGKVESPNPQLLFQSQPHTASQAKPLCGK